MVHIGDDYLVPRTERLSDRQTHQTNKGCGIHAKGNFIHIACVYQISDALPGPRNRLIHFPALCVTATSLHIAVEQMMIHRVQHALRNLSTGGIVEKDESWSSSQCRKDRANRVDGKV